MTRFDITTLFNEAPAPTTYRVINAEDGSTIGSFDSREEAQLAADKQNEWAVQNGYLSYDPDGSPVVPHTGRGAYYVVR